MTTTVRTDVFPAVVTFNRPDSSTQTLDRVRVIIVAGTPADRVFVFQDHADGPRPVFSAQVLSHTAPRTPQRLREVHSPEFSTHEISTPAANLSVLKSSGCGCGSRLKSFNPFPSINALAAS